MKNFTLGLAVLFGGAIMLSGACSSDDAADDGGSGASTSKGGSGGSTSSGGATSSGGTTNTGSGGENTGSGGENTGSGGENTGSGGENTGSGGETAAGGAGSNPEGCPTDAPMDGGDCFVEGGFQNACEYVGTSCSCFGYGNGGPGPGGNGAGGGAAEPGEWNCIGDGEACPETAPMNEDACTEELDCPYPGGNTCQCDGEQWTCIDFGGGECPDEAPTQGEDCEGLLFGCDGCNCVPWGPNANTWDCN
jgi:hypothetical protein